MDPKVKAYRQSEVLEEWGAEAERSSFEGVVEYLNRIVYQQTKHPRWAIIRSLSHAGHVSSLNIFRENLPSHDSQVQRYAATGLGRTGDVTDVFRLKHYLRLQEYIILRARVAQALGWLGYNECVEPLFECHIDPNLVVRKAAAKALARVCNVVDSVEERLLLASQSDDIDLKRFAAKTMGYIVKESCVSRLVELVWEHNPRVYRVAAQGLERIVNRGVSLYWPVSLRENVALAIIAYWAKTSNYYDETMLNRFTYKRTTISHLTGRKQKSIKAVGVRAIIKKVRG
ncbi:MAG: HEAT repeat domain-containing protein [Desulfobacterales bacterium]|nr:HEAT repeat domain-containing protein [Desulfobacterales bacterium]MCP4159395.1 HEAT repeat domain-containing protein [Deltaproteobacteria bacterium]